MKNVISFVIHWRYIILASYVEEIIAKVQAENPGETEFHNTVKEVLTSIAPVLEKNPKYQQASDEEISKELTKSRDTIKNKLGIDADFMAYPTGTYNLHIAELVQKAGYKGAFTIKYDNVSRESNVYALERVPIFHTENTNKDFLERIQYLPLIYKYGWVKN